ncbi:p21-C-terminal region-binding protein-domain-containing protein [Crepidotus variabilis]|uniref:Protein BCP1 n=1 Tax=Crepidotus variabilis TaxID=179855 RepID=A0A9P6EDM8_9AGAR|nr:p21-C-terminal region-binding protein-domain-containing protein [Crepidotus variabilis]
MSKRKQLEDDEDAGSSSSDVLIDVEFDFFDPNPKVDYHAIKRLLGQLFQRDAEQLDTPELTELILAQPTVGTTIKTDGLESDPYALLTVLNMHLHHLNPSMKAIANYLLAITSAHNQNFHSILQTLFSQSEAHVGLVVCERLINMPVQVIPPMYRMLADEVKWARADGEPYNFTHLIVISRVYHLSEEEESVLENSAGSRRARTMSNADGNASPKKHKKQRSEADQATMARPSDGIYPYHPEDDVINQLALHALTFPYQAPLPDLVQETRSRDSLGLDIRGRIFLLPGGEETIRDLGSKMAETFTTS